MQANERFQDDASIASRYLTDGLSDSERQAYEQYFLRNPDAVQELEATARMQVGLANLRDSGQLDTLLHAPGTTSRRPIVIALAASVAVAAIGVLLWRGVSDIREPALMASAAALVDRYGQPLPTGYSYALLRTRSFEYDALVQLPAESQAIELRVLPESQAPAYRATLSRIYPDGTVGQVAAVSDLRPEIDRFVRLYVDSSRLEAGPYLLVLSSAQQGAGEAPTSSFRLKMQNAGAAQPQE